MGLCYTSGRECRGNQSVCWIEPRHELLPPMHTHTGGAGGNECQRDLVGIQLMTWKFCGKFCMASPRNHECIGTSPDWNVMI